MHDHVVRAATIVDGTGAPPFAGDVAVDGGLITEIADAGSVGAATQTLDGDGLILAPGWVDVHTHYDGQVTWDPSVTPSSWHGVTTVVMGNCGVGFAPVRPDARDFLIELMESIEDIPGSALHEGIDWDWESFPQYLDALDARRWAIDVAAQVPHAALRAFVLGERAHEDATPEEVEEMARLVEDALRAGAVGFTTSRTILHRSRHGYEPGTFAPTTELLEIASAIGRAGRGVFQLVSDRAGTDEELTWLSEVADRTGGAVTYALAQTPWDPTGYRNALTHGDNRLVPQVSVRPTGMLFGLQSSLHPFITHPTYRRLATLPLSERVAAMRTPEIRAALLREEPSTDNQIAVGLMQRWNLMFPLGDPPDYEPPFEESAAGVAAARGTAPEEVVYDWLLERDGTALLFAPLASYVDGDHEALREMMSSDAAVVGLSDGGAHCGLICDASFPTFLLTHWVRDRTRGPRLPLEYAVHVQTGRTASLYGFTDRGTIEVGKRADLNLIDLPALRLHEPEMVFDLPAGGRRLVQKVDGYVATLVAGTVTYAGGSSTGELPGRLVRSVAVASR